jgi:hypothetical protein
VLYAGRAPAAAPATGIAKIHEAEQQALINAALHSTATEDSARETTRLKALSAQAIGAPQSSPQPAPAPAIRKSS